MYNLYLLNTRINIVTPLQVTPINKFLFIIFIIKYTKAVSLIPTQHQYTTNLLSFQPITTFNLILLILSFYLTFYTLIG